MLTKPEEENVLFLHIGTGKAGSTTIQSLLRLMNDPSLGTLPVKAFGYPNAVNLVAASKSTNAKRYFVQKNQTMTEAFFTQNAEELWQIAQLEIAKSPVNRFVASSEFLSSLVRKQDIEFLRDRLLTCFARVEILVIYASRTASCVLCGVRA